MVEIKFQSQVSGKYVRNVVAGELSMFIVVSLKTIPGIPGLPGAPAADAKANIGGCAPNIGGGARGNAIGAMTRNDQNKN